MFEPITRTQELGERVLESTQDFVLDYKLKPQPDSLQEQINQFSRERNRLRALGTEWSELGQLLKKSKKCQNKEFKRLVKESQYELDLRF